MKRVFFLLTPTATITAILISRITPTQAQELVANSMFNSVIVQHSPEIPSRQLESSPPPVDGRPDNRTPAGTRVAPPPLGGSSPATRVTSVQREELHISGVKEIRDAIVYRSNQVSDVLE